MRKCKICLSEKIKRLGSSLLKCRECGLIFNEKEYKYEDKDYFSIFPAIELITNKEAIFKDFFSNVTLSLEFNATYLARSANKC